MKYVDNGITFNKVDTFVFPIGQKVASVMYDDPSGDTLSSDDIGGIDFGIVNAINIDWNGADVNGTVINTTGQVLKKIAQTEIEIENIKNDFSNNIKLPAKIIAFYTYNDYVEATLGNIEDIKIFNTEIASFSINDSLINNFTIERTNRPQYSVFAYPQSFGTFNIPANYQPILYTTEFNKEPYNAIISLTKNKSFIPIKIIR